MFDPLGRDVDLEFSDHTASFERHHRAARGAGGLFLLLLATVRRRPFRWPVLISTSRQARRVSPEPRRPAVFKSALTFFAAVARVAKRLPLFRPASIERELEQTLRMVRCSRQQREKAAARRRVSVT